MDTQRYGTQTSYINIKILPYALQKHQLEFLIRSLEAYHEKFGPGPKVVRGDHFGCQKLLAWTGKCVRYWSIWYKCQAHNENAT